MVLQLGMWSGTSQRCHLQGDNGEQVQGWTEVQAIGEETPATQGVVAGTGQATGH